MLKKAVKAKKTDQAIRSRKESMKKLEAATQKC